jgi:hypothetical protein
VNETQRPASVHDEGKPVQKVQKKFWTHGVVSTPGRPAREAGDLGILER